MTNPIGEARPDDEATGAADLGRPEGPEALEEARRSDEFRNGLRENASAGSGGSDAGPDGAPEEPTIDRGLGLVDRPEVPRD